MPAEIPQVPQVPQVPAAPNPQPQNQSGFNVPPAGSSEPHKYPGQVPGYVRRDGNAGEKQVADTADKATPELPEGIDIAALVAAALGKKEESKPGTEKPGWVPPKLSEFDIDSIDDPIIKSMATVLKVAAKDMDLDRVLGNALAHGDPNLIDVAYIAEKGGANAQQLLEISRGIIQAIEAKSNAITAEVHAMVGGAEVWSRSAAVFNQMAPEALRMTVKNMLDSTNSEYIKAGAKIVAEFGKQSGVVSIPGATVQTAGARAAAQGLSAQQFKAELFKLNPNAPGYLEARNELFQRRAIGKRAGM